MIGPVDNATANLIIGSNSDGTRTFDGSIDEARISNIVRNACWIGTEYNNQSSPGTYLTLGTEVTPAPTAVTFKVFKATDYDGGVLLQWKTGYEVDNLGFHIYREENGKLVRLTPEPVAGSAFLAGQGTALTAGHSYFWWDASLVLSLHPFNWSIGLEDIDLSGKRTMHGPVTPVISREPLPKKLGLSLLSELGIGWRRGIEIIGG